MWYVKSVVKWCIPALLALSFVACDKVQDSKEPKEAQTQEQSSPATNKQASDEPMLGNDRDAHGCIPSAGYTWSELENACVRVFESGIALKNLRDKSATSAAFVIIKDNKAELFLPLSKRDGQDSHVILSQSGEAQWSARGYTLTRDSQNKLTLTFNSQAIYAQE